VVPIYTVPIGNTTKGFLPGRDLGDGSCQSERYVSKYEQKHPARPHLHRLFAQRSGATAVVGLFDPCTRVRLFRHRSGWDELGPDLTRLSSPPQHEPAACRLRKDPWVDMAEGADNGCPIWRRHDADATEWAADFVRTPCMRYSASGG